MKYILLPLFGAVIGALLPLVWEGDQNYTKKSMRASAPIETYVVFAGVGAAVGLGLAFMLGITQAEDKKFGFDKIESGKYKDGRGCGIITFWTNPETGNRNEVETKKLGDTLVTIFNGKITHIHEQGSQSEKVVRACHNPAMQEILKKIKAKQIIQN